VNGVYYVADGERWAVVPSNAGSTREPAWWLNLQADPNARVRVGTVEYAARARVATPDEERRLWPRLEAMLPAYREYRAVAGRAIPIVLLERGNGA
jgi:deazaflavin-dependent oxidoreductase (nitroreductase family)